MEGLIMKAILSAGLIGFMSATVIWHSGPRLAAQADARPCEVDGAKYPELIPEYYAWDFYFRTMLRAASGNPEGNDAAKVTSYHPAVVRNIATLQLGITEQEFTTFLDVAADAVRKVEGGSVADVRGVPLTALTGREQQIAVADIILDGRDELARRLSPRAFQAVRRQLPVRSTVFTFPSQ